MDLTKLTQPFDPSLIKNREAPWGGTYDYLETHVIIQRLNEAFEGEWDFDIVSERAVEDTVIVRGVLKAQGVTKSQFGSHIARDYEGSWGDAYKSAASDALKKCATLFGVALELYSDDTNEEAPLRKPQSKPDAPQNGKKQYDTPMPNKIEVDCFKCPEKIAIGAGYSLPPGTWGNDTDKWQSYHKDCYQKREAAGATTPVSIPDDDEVPF